MVCDAEGQEDTLTIVGEDEIDAEQGRISYRSPVGRALIGREEGEEVTINTPGGKRVLELLAVRYPTT